jgi:hypothetical protein
LAITVIAATRFSIYDFAIRNRKSSRRDGTIRRECRQVPGSALDEWRFLFVAFLFFVTPVVPPLGD